MQHLPSAAMAVVRAKADRYLRCLEEADWQECYSLTVSIVSSQKKANHARVLEKMISRRALSERPDLCGPLSKRILEESEADSQYRLLYIVPITTFLSSAFEDTSYLKALQPEVSRQILTAAIESLLFLVECHNECEEGTDYTDSSLIDVTCQLQILLSAMAKHKAAVDEILQTTAKWQPVWKSYLETSIKWTLMPGALAERRKDLGFWLHAIAIALRCPMTIYSLPSYLHISKDSYSLATAEERFAAIYSHSFFSDGRKTYLWICLTCGAYVYRGDPGSEEQSRVFKGCSG